MRPTSSPRFTGANGQLEASFAYDPNGNLVERRSSNERSPTSVVVHYEG